jgi:hypothetical protein
MAKLTSDALVTAKVVLANQAFDNTLETPPKDATGTYAVISINFPSTMIETIGCEGMEQIIGSCSVVLYTPKCEGMIPAETVMQEVIKEWVRVNRGLQKDPTKPNPLRLKTRNISGPNALTPDQRPHQVTQLSCVFTAKPA